MVQVYPLILLWTLGKHIANFGLICNNRKFMQILFFFVNHFNFILRNKMLVLSVSIRINSHKIIFVGSF